MIFAACKGSSGPRDAPATPPAPTPPAPAPAQIAPADAAAPDPAASPDKIVFEVVRPITPGTGFAKRCAISGDPLTSTCRGGGLAFDRAGVLHLVSGTAVRRFRVTAGEPCTLEADGAPLELPPVPTRSQRVDGPVYMRSGGPAWAVVSLGDALYAHDFLAGIYRIDRGRAVPACTDQFGFRSYARLGKRLLAGRSGIEQLDLRAKGACKARPADVDPKARGTLHVIGDKLYVADTSRVTRYDRTTATPIAEATRLCAITAITACGEGRCLLDKNCPQLVQLASDDSLLRKIEGRELFDVRPYALEDATSAGDGTLFMLAHHRDVVAGKEVCEAAVYAVPPAVFAR